MENCPSGTIEIGYSDGSFSCEVASTFDERQTSNDYFSVTPGRPTADDYIKSAINEYSEQNILKFRQEIINKFKNKSYRITSLKHIKNGLNHYNTAKMDKIINKIVNSGLTQINLELRTGHTWDNFYFIKELVKQIQPGTSFNLFDGSCHGVRDNFPKIQNLFLEKGLILNSYYGTNETGFSNINDFLMGRKNLSEAKNAQYIEYGTRKNIGFKRAIKMFNMKNQVNNF